MVGTVSEQNILLLNTEDGPARTETRLFLSHIKCIKMVGLCSIVFRTTWHKGS